MKQGLKNRITNYFKNRPSRFINAGEVEALAINVGYKGSTASRQMRYLASEGVLDRKIEMKSVWYKYNI